MPKDDHPPSFPLYVDDFISDSAVDAMTNEELGMYVRLLCKAWKEAPVGTVPDNDRILASWSKATPAAWKRCREGVMRAFTQGDDGRWHQKRMKLEWQKLLDHRESKSKAGSKGMAKRWQNDNRPITDRITKGITKNNLSSSPSLSPSISIDGDDDGARYSSFSEKTRVRARRIATFVRPERDEDMELVAKVAMLADAGEISENDLEQVLESYAAAEQPIRCRPAWFHECLANRVTNFNQLLAMTDPPEQFRRKPA